MAKAKTNASLARSAVKNKNRHGWTAVLFVLGTLLPPLAVAARFGVGKDLLINIPLTICGYIPGHVHNFYLQNIRNNSTHNRTPKWAVRYGLVNTKKLERNKKRSEWSHRYDGDDPSDLRTKYARQAVEEGQNPDPVAAPRRVPDGEAPLWQDEDEQYYGQQGQSRSSTRNRDPYAIRDAGPSTGSLSTMESAPANGKGSKSKRWHYPANYDEADEIIPSRSDRARTQDSYDIPTPAPAPVRNSAGGKKISKKNKLRTGGEVLYTADGSGDEGPEDAVGGQYGSRQGQAQGQSTAVRPSGGPDGLNHSF